MSGTELQADWAAQRIKNMSLMTAVARALLPRRNRNEVTSLIEEFQYPRLGPGQMWDCCAEKIRGLGGVIQTDTRVVAVHHSEGLALAVTVRDAGGASVLTCDAVVSSMPLSQLITVMTPPAPMAVQAAAASLRYRDFLTVALVVPERFSFPDNWIYIHTPGVKVGRVQNFGSWSPDLVKDGRTCLGLEFFVDEGDALWDASDLDLVNLGIREIDELGLVQADAVEAGYVVRMPKAYPVYDASYAGHVQTIRDWLRHAVPNVHPVGRNGMHKYNNQDHSMLTAMLAAKNILGEEHDVWSVNVDEDYHEEQGGRAVLFPSGTGREAPLHPLPTQAAG